MMNTKVKKFVDPEKYIQWRKEGKSRNEICELLGIDMRTLQIEIVILRERGLIKKGDVSNGRPVLFNLTKEEYIEEARTKTDTQIAKEQGVSRCVVTNRRRKWGLPRRTIKVTLTYEEYKELKKQNLSDREIEKKLGYTKGTVDRLKALVWVIFD